MNDSADILDREIWEAMMSTKVPEKRVDTIPIGEKIKFLIKNIDSVSIDDKRPIGNILIMRNMGQHLKECAEGTIINLNNLDDEVISDMYSLLEYKLSKMVK